MYIETSTTKPRRKPDRIAYTFISMPTTVPVQELLGLYLPLQGIRQKNLKRRLIETPAVEG